MFHTSKSCEQLKMIKKEIQMFQGLSDVCSVSYLKQWRKDAEVTTKEKNLH